MNSRITFSLALAGILFLNSCAEKAPEIPTEAIVAGKIDNSTGGEALFRISEKTDTAIVSSDGTFNIKIKLEKASYIQFFYGGEYSTMYLQPGDSVYMTVNPEEFDESMKFEGNGANSNNYLAELYLLNEGIGIKHPYMSRYEMDPMDFRYFSDSIKTVKTEFLQKFNQNTPLPPALVVDQEASIVYQWATDLTEYSENMSYMEGKDSIQIPDDYFTFLKDAPIERPELIENKDYLNFVNTRCGQMAHEKVMARDSTSTSYTVNLEKIQTINSEIKNQELKNVFLHSAMMDILDFEGSSDVSEIMNIYKSACTDSSKIKTAEKEFAEWQLIIPGMPAPDFNYEQFGSTNKVSLSSLAGKVVYIDVWATWCGPCRREIPDLQTLEADYKNQNIAFVSVSIDESREAWESMVSDDQLGGIQLLAENDWKSSICADYKINGIPRFILVGSDGKIISADADRPSSAEIIRNNIDEALSKTMAQN